MPKTQMQQFLSIPKRVFSVRLDTAYFVENWKLITKNTIAKYFLLLQITIHIFFSIDWSMNNAMDKPKKTQSLYTQMQPLSQTHL